MIAERLRTVVLIQSLLVTREQVPQVQDWETKGRLARDADAGPRSLVEVIENVKTENEIDGALGVGNQV